MKLLGGSQGDCSHSWGHSFDKATRLFAFPPHFWMLSGRSCLVRATIHPVHSIRPRMSSLLMRAPRPPFTILGPLSL